MSKFVSMTGAALILGAAVAISVPAPAQTVGTSAPAVPDFSGLWQGRRGAAPEPSGRLGVQQHPDHERRGSRGEGGVRQAPLPAIADTTDSLLQPWVAAALKDIGDRRAAGEIILPARSLCWPNGVPAIIELGGTPLQFLQTQDQVTIHRLEGPEVRHIYLNVPHSENVTPSWYGESVGHYEGNTLVVDTIGLNDRTVVDDFQTPHTEALHVVERYTLLEDGETIEIQYTVEDPEAFTEQWTGAHTLQRVTREPVFEELYCAENNFDVLTGGEYPLPTATKLDF